MLPDMSKNESQKSQGITPLLLLQLVQAHLEGGDLLVDPPEAPPLLPQALPLQAELPQPSSPRGPALWSRESPHITGREALLFLRTVSQLKS